MHIFTRILVHENLFPEVSSGDLSQPLLPYLEEQLLVGLGLDLGRSTARHNK